MKITDIKQQVKRKDRYSIYIDNKYSFALSESGLIGMGLKIGDEFSSEDLTNFKKSADIDKGIYRCLDLISRRPRSRWELEDYLKRKGYDAEQTSQIILELNDKGYINDHDFARRWVDNRRLLKSISDRRLRLELRQKRVDDSVVDIVLEENPADQKAIIKELIEKKQRQTRYKDKEKLIAYLARQGFYYGDIKEALEEE